ncbi:hypothetical protein ACMFMF_007041 [Clarireedia jacksonii]
MEGQEGMGWDDMGMRSVLAFLQQSFALISSFSSALLQATYCGRIREQSQRRRDIIIYQSDSIAVDDMVSLHPTMLYLLGYHFSFLSITDRRLGFVQGGFFFFFFLFLFVC